MTVPDIDDLLRESPIIAQNNETDPSGKKRVLIATSMGGFNQGAVTEKALAIALTLRGAVVDIFLCDGAPGCQLTKIGSEPPERVVKTDARARCPKCFRQGRETFEPLGVDILTLGDHLTLEEREEAERVAARCYIETLQEFTLDGWRIGDHAMAGALRYFARGDLSAEPLADPVARKFVKASVITARAMARILSARNYDVIAFNHGIYTPQGVIGEVARSRGVRVVNWNPAYRRHCFIFSHDESYHHTMITEDVAAWEDLTLTPDRRAAIVGYLRDRRQAKGDWIWFNDAPDMSSRELADALGLDERPVVAALTSVVWDACLHYESNAFENLKDWMIQTIAWFAERADLQLVIRVHPAEVTGFVKSRDKMADAIADYFPELPENVKVVPPESPLSTYSLIDCANAVLVYSTKTGIEASAAGARVIVAGEAWIRGKGFTMDASSPRSYREMLALLPFRDRLPEDLQERALRYAYHFFFRRMIDLPFIEPVEAAKFAINVERLEDLRPGNYSGLDCICDGILEGTPFVHDWPAEPVAQAPAATRA
ncbi:MAG: capsule biosynthesis protein [Parvularculaceae bacterium]